MIRLLERTIRESVFFNQPFRAEGSDRERPAGTYMIETVETLIEELSFVAYRCVSTSIVLPLSGGASGSYELAKISPSVVEAARHAMTSGPVEANKSIEPGVVGNS